MPALSRATPMDLSKLQTEGRNPASAHIDQVSSLEICQIINREDATVAHAVADCLPDIAAAVDALAERVRRGGRVIYVGAGTSGRLGVLDASEIPPTYSAPHEQFIALMAGGDAAIRRAQEGAEDSTAAAETDLGPLKLRSRLDSLIGIAASGQTPYVLGCLAYAKRAGCLTIGVACSAPSAMGDSGLVDHMIAPVTGPEVVTGSTRMKAGTATKLVLNTLSTAVMIRAGKTFGNMMVDMKPSNKKLKQRARNIIRSLSGSRAPPSDADIDALLNECDNSVKLALAVLHLGVSIDEAIKRLEAAGGVLANAIQQAPERPASPKHDTPEILPLVLCVDGGASKCAAVVMDASGRTGKGLAGPCNVTNVSVDAATSTVSLAVENALQEFGRNTSTQQPSLQSVDFRRVWVGLAGYDRAHLQLGINTALSQLFRLPIGPRLHVSNDIDLQTASLAGNPAIESIVALVAGTGSVAMQYSTHDLLPSRTGRSGGWGHLLGDDGSGFDLGRQAIRHTLALLDQVQPQPGNTRLHDLGALPRRVLAHVRLDRGVLSNTELLTAIMAPAGLDAPADIRTRIAELGRVVIEAANEDADACAIMEKGIKALVRTLKALVAPTALEKQRTGLVLGGGLLQNRIYQDSLLARIKQEGLTFSTMHFVHDPAMEGARFLTSSLGTRNTNVQVKAKL